MKLQAQASGLNDDQLCAELNIQPAQWSRIMNGAAHFPTEKYHRFNQITCSHYVLLWDLWTNGFDPESIRPLRSDLERRLEESEARNQTLEHEMAIMQRYIRMASGRNG